MNKLQVLIVALLPLTAQAAQTQQHELAGFSAFARGKFPGSSLRSDASVVLGPKLQKRNDKLGAQVLAVQADKKGGAYVATGDPAQVFYVDAKGGERLLFTAPEPLITALHYDAKNKALYVASGPKGRLYRLALDSKEVISLCRVEAQYVWGFAARGGHIYAATGLPGTLVRLQGNKVCPKFASLPEKHARSVVVAKDGQFVVGGGEKGVVYRVSGKGEVQALLDTALQEITGLVVDEKGTLFIAAVSAKAADKTAQIEFKERADVADTGGKDVAKARLVKASEVYRVGVDNDARLLWSSKKDGAYALAVFDDKLWIATGGRGRLYSVQTKAPWERSFAAELGGAELTAMDTSSTGLFVASSANGALWQIGQGRAASADYLSPVLDSKRQAKYGALQSVVDLPPGAKVSYAIRQGNTPKVDARWGAFVDVLDGQDPGLKQRSRYVQIRARLNAGAKGRSPRLLGLNLAFRNSNLRPEIKAPKVLAPNIRIEPMPAEEPKGRSFAVDDKAFADFIPKAGKVKALRPGKTQVKQTFAAGWQSLSWAASDKDGDRLRAQVQLMQIDGVILADLAKDLEQSFFSFESSRWPDGLYQIRLSVDDGLDNYPGEAERQQATSPVFRIDHSPPVIKSLQGRRDGTQLKISFSTQDASALRQAWCSVDGGAWQVIPSRDGMIDSSEESFALNLQAPKAGSTTVLRCRVEDQIGNQAQGALRIK